MVVLGGACASPPPADPPEPEPVAVVAVLPAPASEPASFASLEEALGGAWRGETRTKGSSPVVLTLRFHGASSKRVDAKLDFLAYDKTAFSQTVPFQHECHGPGMRGVAKDVGRPCASIVTHVKDVHPVYDYEESTSLSCVIGGPNVRAMCRVAYTDWFELTRERATADP